MLESCMRPDLVTEITLQPVRRHGVDAAIFFSDIVVPLKAIGIDLDIKPGVGPVVAEPDPHPRRPRRSCATLEPGRRLVRHRGDRPAHRPSWAPRPLIGFAGAPFTLASYLVEGGPSADHERTKALMYGDPQLWARPARPARRHHRRLPEGPDRGGRQRRPALRLLGRRAGPGGLPPLRAAGLGRRSSSAVAGVRRPAHPLRRRHRRAARPDGRGRRRRGRRRLAGAAGRGRTPGRPRQGAPGQPRPGRALRPDRGRRGRRPARCWRRGRPARATSSTSATASCPPPTRTR